MSYAMYVCIYVCMYVRTYVCMYTHMHACKYTCMIVHMYTCYRSGGSNFTLVRKNTNMPSYQEILCSEIKDYS